MRQNTGRNGYTLIEALIAIAILATFVVFVFSNILNTRRVASLEDIRLDMDRSANGALREIGALVKDAFLPVRSFQGGGTAKRLNLSPRGFGTYAGKWEKALVEGRNYFAFCDPVDLDGSGDFLDGEFFPYLGVRRFGRQVNDANYDVATFTLPAVSEEDGGKEAVVTDVDDDEDMTDEEKEEANAEIAALFRKYNVNPGLAFLRPAMLDGLNPPPADLSTADLPDGAYGIVRFVPYREDGEAATVSETELKCDFNNDGVLNDTRYYVGNLEIFYPAVSGTIMSGAAKAYSLPASRRPLATMNMVLAPGAGDGAPKPNDIPPIFSLVAMDANGGLYSGSSTRFDALRVQITMLNYHDRGARGRSRHNMRFDVVTPQNYEAVFRLRSH